MTNSAQRNGVNPGTRGLLLIGGLAIVGWLLLLRMGGSGGTSVDIADSLDDVVSQAESVAPASSEVEVLSPAPDSTAAARNPASVSVVVLNGTTKTGLARSVIPTLTTAGFTQTSAKDADMQNYAASVVYYAIGYEAEARSIASTLGITTVEAVGVPAPRSGEAANVFVVLGTDKATGVAATTTASTVAGAAAVVTSLATASSGA